MNNKITNVNKHLNHIINTIGSRSVGSINNQKTQKYIADVFQSNGFIVTEPAFDCFDWYGNEVDLEINSENIKVSISPLSMPCEVSAGMVLSQSISEIEKNDFKNKIAILAGELTKEALMPKSFVFYNPEHHKKIIKLLEEKKPLATIKKESINEQQ